VHSKCDATPPVIFQAWRWTWTQTWPSPASLNRWYHGESSLSLYKSPIVCEVAIELAFECCYSTSLDNILGQRTWIDSQERERIVQLLHAAALQARVELATLTVTALRHTAHVTRHEDIIANNNKYDFLDSGSCVTILLGSSPVCCAPCMPLARK